MLPTRIEQKRRGITTRGGDGLVPAVPNVPAKDKSDALAALVAAQLSQDRATAMEYYLGDMSGDIPGDTGGDTPR